MVGMNEGLTKTVNQSLWESSSKPRWKVEFEHMDEKDEEIGGRGSTEVDIQEHVAWDR